MDQDQKNRFDSLDKLKNACFESFNTRRSYEWKFCLSLWTVLTLFIGQVLFFHPLEITNNLKTQPAIADNQKTQSTVADNQETQPANSNKFGTLLFFLFTAIIIFIFLFQSVWIMGIGKANKLDQLFAYKLYENEMKKILEIEETEEIKKLKDGLGKNKGLKAHWAYQTELSITFVLGLAAIGVVYNKFNCSLLYLLVGWGLFFGFYLYKTFEIS